MWLDIEQLNQQLKQVMPVHTYYKTIISNALRVSEVATACVLDIYEPQSRNTKITSASIPFAAIRCTEGRICRAFP